MSVFGEGMQSSLHNTFYREFKISTNSQNGEVHYTSLNLSFLGCHKVGVEELIDSIYKNYYCDTLNPTNIIKESCLFQPSLVSSQDSL